MSRPTHRVKPLTADQKTEFVNTHIPGRIRLIEQALRHIANSYYHFTVAAVHGRVLAQFLGLKLSKSGTLGQDRKYFPHDGNHSYEVKLPDVCKLPLLDPASFSHKERRALEIGFDTINREVVHFTYWDTKPRHHALDTATGDYYAKLVARLRPFCEIVVRETERCLQRA